MMASLTILMVFAVLIGIAVLLLRPMWAFLLITIMFGLEQLLQSYFPVFQANQRLFNYAVGGTALLSLFLRVLRRDPIASGLNNPVTYLVAAQFGLWLAAMLYSPAPDMALASLEGSWQYLVLLVLVLPLLIVDLKEFRKILVGTMLVGGVMALLILLNPKTSYYAGRLVLDLGMTGLRKDRFGNPLAVAELGGTVALIAALIAPGQRRGVFNALRVAAFMLGLGLAIGSGSRGQVLATAVAGIMFFPAARRINNVRNFFFTTIGLLILIAGVYLSFQLFIGDQNRRRWDIELMVKDIGGRFDMCWLFIEEWLKEPEKWLFGLGTNAWVDIAGASDLQGGYVHNIAVEILCEHGVLGAAIFVAMTILTIRAGVRMWRLHRDDPTLRSAAAIFLALCAFALFNALKQGNITSATPFYLWLVLAKIARREELALAGRGALEPAPPEWTEPDYQIAPGYAAAR